MTNNNTIKINGFNALNNDQKAAIAAILGVSADAIQDNARVSTVNNLTMKDGSDTIAIDRFNQKEFDITQLTDEELANAKKTGLSPESYNTMQLGMQIKAAAATSKARGPRTGVSAGQQVRDIVNNYIDKIDDKAIALLLDKDYSKKNMSLAYPMFIEIPANTSDADKKELRKVNGTNRFASTVYTFKKIPNRQFFMTNDLYAKNIDKVATTFDNLFKADKTDKKKSAKKVNIDKD